MAVKRKTARRPRQVPAQKRSGASKPMAGGAKKPARPLDRIKSTFGRKGASKGKPSARKAKAQGKKAAVGKTERIQLRWIAQARSGDKGDIANVALFAPTPETYAIFLREVTADRVKKHFGAYVKGRVDRYEAPNVRALNFVCHAALGGGGAASMRSDPLGKSYGSNLLRMEVDIPSDVLRRTPKLVAPKELPEV